MKKLDYTKEQDNFRLDEVFMYDEGGDFSRTLYYIDNVFHAVAYEPSDDYEEVRFFKLVKPYEEFTDEEKEDVLTYTLGEKYNRNQELLYPEDIFVHGKYLTEIVDSGSS